jgi:DNA-binding transcriptional regulator YiaG
LVTLYIIAADHVGFNPAQVGTTIGRLVATRKPAKKEQAITTELYRRRIARGLTQVQLADLCEVNQTSISNWDQGRRVPKGKYAKRRLEDVLGAPISVLIGPPTENAATPKDGGAMALYRPAKVQEQGLTNG